MSARMSRFALFIAALLASVLLCGTAVAQQFPNRRITIIMGFAAGSSNDIIARLIAGKMSDKLNVPVIVENRPGANQLNAIRTLLGSPPDGYTLFVGNSGALAQNLAVQKNLPYHPLKDFTFVATLGVHPGLLVVNAALPVRDAAGLVEYTKSNPGKLNYGSGGIGSSVHLAMEYFTAVTGTKMVHIPLKSDAVAVVEMSTGRIEASILTAIASLGAARDGKLRILATTSVRRIPFLPDVPTLAEAGLAGLEGLDPFAFAGLVGPAGIPPNIVRKLNDEVNDVLRSPEVTARMHNDLRVEPMVETPQGFREFVEGYFARWNEMAKKIRIETN